jgi:hypothetical protein
MINPVSILFIAFTLIMPTLSMAADPVTRTTTLKVGDPKMDMDNGRTYILKNGAVIEEIELSAASTQRNIFDFSNGVVYHERPNGTDVSYGTTPFTQLPPGRVAEIQAIGCEVAAKSGALVRGKDDVEYFVDRYCAKE